MSFVITDQNTITALKNAYNVENWQEAYGLLYKPLRR
jgi:hypothetical protein